MQIPFVGFQPLRTSEHMAALGVFGLLQIIAFLHYLRSATTKKQFEVNIHLIDWVLVQGKHSPHLLGTCSR